MNRFFRTAMATYSSGDPLPVNRLTRKNAQAKGQIAEAKTTTHG